MMYVVMALTVVAAIGISITLVATNLFSRTASKSSDQQAYLLAKSIGQGFVAEDQYVRNIINYLSDHPNEKVVAKASVYYDPSTMATSTNVNTQYLTGLAVNDAYISFRLSEDTNYLYGDVNVTYNGASAVATVVLTCINQAGFDQNMQDLFNHYNIYATQPNGLSFNMTGQQGGSVYPPVKIYNDKSTPAEYLLEADMNADLTMEGAFQVRSANSTKRNVNGDLTSYGDLQLHSNINVPAVTGKGLYVNGNLTVGRQGYKSTVTIARDVYCLSSVSVYSLASDAATVVSGTIFAKGNVTVTNAIVGDVRSTSGTLRITGGRVQNLSTQGSVELDNCVVEGDVYAGNLVVKNSTIKGSVTVQGSSIVSAESILPKGNMEVYLDSTATTDRQIGSTVANNIYVSGDLIVSNYSPSYSLVLHGTVEVEGGLRNPLNSAATAILSCMAASRRPSPRTAIPNTIISLFSSVCMSRAQQAPTATWCSIGRCPFSAPRARLMWGSYGRT